MIARTELLYELFLALFESAGELRRFLVLAGFEDVEKGIERRKVDEVTPAALRATELLEERELVGESLFASLAQRDPDRIDDIEQVAQGYGVSVLPEVKDGNQQQVGTAGDTVGSRDEETSAVSAYLLELEEAFEATARGVATAKNEVPDHWPWQASAAVLGSFRATTLAPMSPPSTQASARSALVSDSIVVPDGQWVLKDEVRRTALRRLQDSGRLGDALEANQEIPDRRRDILARLASTREVQDLWVLSREELDDTLEVLRWVDDAEVISIGVDRDDVLLARERRALIEPLQTLVGKHFRGRQKELNAILEFLEPVDATNVRVIWGPGGVGKSSLVGKILLDLEKQSWNGTAPFVYLDFDKKVNDPFDQLVLLRNIAEQLRLLSARSARSSPDFAAVESAAAGTDLDFVSSVLGRRMEAGTPEGLVNELGDRLEALSDSRGISETAPAVSLVIVLDTFERVQVRGPGAVSNVMSLLSQFVDRLKDVKIIVSGRAPLDDSRAMIPRQLRKSIQHSKLGDLDRSGALSALEAFGVESLSLAEAIYTRFGGNPLTLRLAAEVLHRAGPEQAFERSHESSDLLAEIAVEQLQGMLYDRILGHLSSSELISLAHPGLVVRRVTPAIIREVLALPCGLNPAEADRLFGSLMREVSLFELEDDGALRHRQDIRQLMLSSMALEKPRRDQIRAIHDAAIEFYAKKKGRTARIEQLYHRLMRGDSADEMDTLWVSRSRRMQVSLAPMFEEPLPVTSRSWLEARFGLNEGSAGTWDQATWEASAYSRAQSWLSSSAPSEAIAVLGERTNRMANSRLSALEVLALTRVGETQKAASVVRQKLDEAGQGSNIAVQLELRRASIELAGAMKNGADVASAGLSAARLADANGEPLEAIEILSEAAELARTIEDPEAHAVLAQELSDRFVALPRSELQENPLLVRQAVEAVGTSSVEPLMKAALELDDSIFQQGERLFRRDSFVLGRVLRDVDEGGAAALGELAAEVGLRADSWSNEELARSASRAGRTGKLIAIALDHSPGSQEHIQSVVLDNLIEREQFES